MDFIENHRVSLFLEQVETEDMIAKMKAETGMGMKMYRREDGV